MDYSRLFRLDGREALVIGAGGGIGREVAKALAAQGADVVCADMDVPAAQETAQACAGDARALQLDVTDSAAVDDVAESLPSLRILVFTPAVNVRKRMADYTVEEFDRVVGLNLRSSFEVLRKFASRFADRGGGSIVAFSSIRARTIEPGQGAYAATKAGLEMLVRTAACEFGPDGVRVNAVRPGVVETALTAPLRQNAEWTQAYADKSALGRWAGPEELAGAAVYLAGDAATFVTGSVLTVDGGWTAQDGRYTPPEAP
ncbi:MAG: SDR family NAD(P)-dependent oxidoreductase [Nocardioidaceae bacterium]